MGVNPIKEPSEYEAEERQHHQPRRRRLSEVQFHKLAWSEPFSNVCQGFTVPNFVKREFVAGHFIVWMPPIMASLSFLVVVHRLIHQAIFSGPVLVGFYESMMFRTECAPGGFIQRMDAALAAMVDLL